MKKANILTRHIAISLLKVEGSNPDATGTEIENGDKNCDIRKKSFYWQKSWSSLQTFRSQSKAKVEGWSSEVDFINKGALVNYRAGVQKQFLLHQWVQNHNKAALIKKLLGMSENDIQD